MPQQANGNNLLIGAGKWYFDRFDVSGNSTGLRFLGEAPKGEMTPSVTNKEMFTSTKASRVKIADVNTQQKHTLAIEAAEWTKENVALAFLGTAAAFTQTGVAVTAEALVGLAGQPASAAQGQILRTSKRGISLTTLHATVGNGSPQTLVLGTDYEIEDAKAGLISLLSHAADGATTLTVDYTAASITTNQVSAGLTTKILGRMVFIGDPTNGPGFDVTFWRVKINPASAFSFISDDFTTLPLNVEVLDDSIDGHADLYQLTYR